MKKVISILAFLLLCSGLFSQDENGLLLRMELGPHLLMNSMNEDDYFDYMNSNYSVQNASMIGLNLKFAARFKPGLDIIFGVIADKGWDEFGNSFWNPGSTNSSDFLLNGGGVYAGLNPHTRGEHFGLDAEIAAGILAYKQYRSIFNNTVQPYVDIYDKTSSFFGGIGSIGFYLRGNTLGISPEFQIMMAGGSNGSFLFYGYSVPITISF